MNNPTAPDSQAVEQSSVMAACTCTPFTFGTGTDANKYCPRHTTKPRAELAARPLEVATPVGDARRDEVMRHDFPALQQFHTKHALGPLAAPSCLCCGKSTQGVEIGVQHLELPGIVICKPCKDATVPGGAGGDVGAVNQKDPVRIAGGIVHRDGNIFFTNRYQFEHAASLVCGTATVATTQDAAPAVADKHCEQCGGTGQIFTTNNAGPFDCYECATRAAAPVGVQPAPEMDGGDARREISIPRRLAFATWEFLAQECTPCAMADCQIEGKNYSVDSLKAQWLEITRPPAGPAEGRKG